MIAPTRWRMIRGRYQVFREAAMMGRRVMAEPFFYRFRIEDHVAVVWWRKLLQLLAFSYDIQPATTSAHTTFATSSLPVGLLVNETLSDCLTQHRECRLSPPAVGRDLANHASLNRLPWSGLDKMARPRSAAPESLSALRKAGSSTTASPWITLS